jgi:putative phosphoesterase
MKIAVLADTHIPKRAKRLPGRVYEIINGVDAIIHAGDVLTEEFLQSLNAMAPVYAVLGNNDIGLELPERLELEWDSVKIGVIHDSGASKGRAARMRRMFPTADVVVYGHSHIPMNIREDGLLLFNPGSPTDRRMQPKHTMGLLTLKAGDVDARIVELD